MFIYVNILNFKQVLNVNTLLLTSSTDRVIFIMIIKFIGF